MSINRSEFVFNALASQREEALNLCVSLGADLAIARERIAELEEDLAKLKPQQEAPSPT